MLSLPGTGESTGTLTQAQASPPEATVGNLAMFAENDGVVDIYNSVNGNWSTALLSQPRKVGAAVGLGDLAFFAGGTTPSGAASNEIDIYNAGTNHWSVARLTQAASAVVAGVTGPCAVFVDGTTSLAGDELIDIYNADTGIWSSITSPFALAGAPVAALNGQVIFADPTGASADVDILNLAGDSWSTASL